HVARAAATFPRAHAPYATVPVQHKTAIDHTELESAPVSRLPADTTRVPGCRRAPPRALRPLWSRAVLRQGQCAGSRRAGYAWVSLVGSGAARCRWCSG